MIAKEYSSEFDSESSESEEEFEGAVEMAQELNSKDRQKLDTDLFDVILKLWQVDEKLRNVQNLKERIFYKDEICFKYPYSKYADSRDLTSTVFSEKMKTAAKNLKESESRILYFILGAEFRDPHNCLIPMKVTKLPGGGENRGTDSGNRRNFRSAHLLQNHRAS